MSIMISQNVENLINNILKNFENVLIYIIIFNHLIIIYNESINVISLSIIFFLKID